MDTTTFSLFLGGLCAVAVWRVTRRLTRRGQEERIPTTDVAADAPVIFKKLRALRLGGGVLCLVAAAILYVWQATPVACVLAGGGCWLHYLACRLRARHRLRVETSVSTPASRA